MATRSRRNWKPDSRGYYTRQIGWKRSKSGKLLQPKFILGQDRKEAEKRERKLKELWDTFVSEREETKPIWPDDLLIIAKRIAKGIPEVPVPRGPNEKQMEYANRVQRMQAKYPVVLFLPEDQHAFEIGQAALEGFELIDAPEYARPEIINADVIEALSEAQRRLAEAGLEIPNEVAVLSNHANTESLVSSIGKIKPGTLGQARLEASSVRTKTEKAHVRPTDNARPSRTPRSTLYQAFTAFEKYLEREYHQPELEQISSWGKTQVRQTKTLRAHHKDILLSKLDGDAVDEMVGYWRRRPYKKGTKQPMTAKSASNYCSNLVRFLKWLDRSSRFDWEKPFAFNDIDRRIRRLPSDHAQKSLEQVQTFSLDELVLLMKYAQPIDRLLILLGLNCGFGRAEVASLLVGEVKLHTGHTKRQCELLNYQTTDKDSFIKRVRRKSGVYGEHILFPMTVQGIEWAIEQRKKFPGFADDARLLLNKNGKALDTPTKNGNANQTIPNHFLRLIDRITNDDCEIQRLSFNKLRKTASDLVKKYSDGEIAGVFDCHGQPVKSDALSDAYTNRPFGKVFKAIREVERYLQPVFKAAGSSPFEPQSQAYTKRSIVDRIIRLHNDGYPTGQIAATVGLSGSATSRHIQRHKESL